MTTDRLAKINADLDALNAQIESLREKRRPLLAERSKLEAEATTAARLASMSPDEKAAMAAALAAEKIETAPVRTASSTHGSR